MGFNASAHPVFVHADMSFHVAEESRFEFTLLFEQSFLSVLLSAILLLCTPLRLHSLYRATHKTLFSPAETVKVVSFHEIHSDR